MKPPPVAARPAPPRSSPGPPARPELQQPGNRSEPRRSCRPMASVRLSRRRLRFRQARASALRQAPRAPRARPQAFPNRARCRATRNRPLRPPLRHRPQPGSTPKLVEIACSIPSPPSAASPVPASERLIPLWRPAYQTSHRGSLLPRGQPVLSERIERADRGSPPGNRRRGRMRCPSPAAGDRP